jgi:hypothetical protein
MRTRAPFGLMDLTELRRFLDQADAVVAMENIADGNHNERVIGMRHDVDNYILPAVSMAEWEESRGYRSTYFILHTADYWQDKKLLQESLHAIHEAIREGDDPLDIAQWAVDELRGYGYDVRGVVAHGDKACYEHHFINDEIFTESRRPGYGAADRVVAGVKLEPISRAELGFDYDPNWLPRSEYVSDSGGQWSQPFEDVVERWPSGQLHMLIHPDWWVKAFGRRRAAA